MKFRYAAGGEIEKSIEIPERRRGIRVEGARKEQSFSTHTPKNGRLDALTSGGLEAFSDWVSGASGIR